MSTFDVFDVFERESSQDRIELIFRRRFVKTSNLLVIGLLLCVFLFAMVTNYTQQVDAVNSVLTEEVEAGLAEMGYSANNGIVGEGAAESEEKAYKPATDGVQIYPDGSGGIRLERSLQAPRAIDEDDIIATVTYSKTSDGHVSISGTSTGLAEEVVEEAVDIALAYAHAGSHRISQGSVGVLGLHYAIYAAENGDLVASFASGNFVKHSMVSLMFSLGIPIIVLLVTFFFASVVLSDSVVRPFEEAWKRQQRFVADASHELKTPLSVIMASTSLMRSKPGATVESQARWMDTIDTEAGRMLELVNDMLFLARSTGIAGMAEHELVDFSQLVMGESLTFESLAFERGVEFDVGIMDDVYVMGSPEHLRRLVGILIDNACKYAGPEGWVKLTLVKRDMSLYLKVRNGGPVIPAEDIPYLFDRFYRADKARNRQTGGFGLGLAIAKDIANAHSGSIEVSSSEEKGTCFSVKLPAAVR